ncbi:MAG: hypothetical protein ACI8Z7_000884 [Candidatus Nanohaloarchaea archaeon]|jgi:hypothetical protein
MDFEEKIERLEERVEELEKENRRLKETNEETEGFTEVSSEISRRKFLKKIGLGAAGLGVLGMSPASALNIRSDSLSFYGGSGETSTDFNINSNGDVSISGVMTVNGAINIPEVSSDPSEGNIWIRSDL